MGNQMQRPELGLTGALESVPGREDLSGSNPLPPEDITQSGRPHRRCGSCRAEPVTASLPSPRGVGKVPFPLKPPRVEASVCLGHSQVRLCTGFVIYSSKSLHSVFHWKVNNWSMNWLESASPSFIERLCQVLDRVYKTWRGKGGSGKTSHTVSRLLASVSPFVMGRRPLKVLKYAKSCPHI